MRKRMWWLSLSGFVLLIGVWSSALVCWPWAGANEANYNRIQVGMAKEEVERILGGRGS